MDAFEGPGLAPLAEKPGAVAVPAPDLDAEPAGFVVESDDGTRIHFLDWGGPAAPEVTAAGILLIPGLASTAWTWAPVARRLRSVARVVAMDLRGHGLSDAPVDGYEPDRLTADAIAVAEGSGALGFDAGGVGVGAGGFGGSGGATAAPFVVAGHGFGAAVAAWTANALGDRCAGLVLVDGGFEDLGAAGEVTPGELLAAIEEPPEVLASMAAWLQDRRGFDPATWDADQERSARAQVVETAAGRVKIAVHPHALAGSVRALLAYEPSVVIPAVEAGVVVLLARDEADGRRRRALAAVAADRAAAGRSAITAGAYPGRGHNLPRHEPGAVAAAILGAIPSAPRG